MAIKYFVTCQTKDNFMNVSGITFRYIITGILITFIINSCAVVKTPYLKTEYYQNTVSRIDSIKSEICYSNDSIYAGFSRISITPDLNNSVKKPEDGRLKKVPIAGFGQMKTKFATGIHDSIFVKAVALKASQQLVIIISADLLIMPPNIIDSVSSILSEEGFQRNQLFFSATHTHSSIGGWGFGFLAKIIAGKENIDLEKWLIMQIKKAVTSAVSDLHPARIGTGSFNGSPYTLNRITGDQGKKNDEFNYLIIEQIGKRNAIIGSFSAHATTIGRKNTLISADYPGYWERKMENTEADIALFCGGSMGSQSPVCKGNDFECAKYIGESLADSISLTLKGVKLYDKTGISSLSLPILLPEYHMRLTANINLTSGLSKRLMPLPEDVYLQALRINDLIWFFTPGDFSGESALMIKNLLAGEGYQAIISGYNGSYVGYIIPSEYFYLDHYESKSMSWFGPTMGDYMMDIIGQITNVIISIK